MGFNSGFKGLIDYHEILGSSNLSKNILLLTRHIFFLNVKQRYL